jgi:hypothetical protein
MQYGNSKDMFKEIGIVESRLFAVRLTLERLHECFCYMDPGQRRILKDWFDSHESITDAINAFAELEEGNFADL